MSRNDGPLGRAAQGPEPRARCGALRGGFLPHQRGADAGLVRRIGGGRCSRMAGEERRRLGDRRVRNAPPGHTHAVRAGAGQGGRTDAGDPEAYRSFASFSD